MYIITLLVGLTISPAFLESLATSRNVWDWEEFDGACPSSEVNAIKNFNHTEFEGFWYVIQRYTGGRYMDCASGKYVWQNDTRRFYETLRSWDLRRRGLQSIYRLLFEREAFPNEGQFYVAFEDNNDYYFVDTDYNNYGVVWSCQNGYNNEYNYQNLMVLAKDRYFDMNSIESLNATLAKPPFDKSKLKEIDHKDDRCIYNP